MTVSVAVLVVSIFLHLIWIRLFGRAGEVGDLGIERAGLASSFGGVSDCTELEASELSDCWGLDGIEVDFF